jgi:hypothetical protein
MRSAKALLVDDTVAASRSIFTHPLDTDVQPLNV